MKIVLVVLACALASCYTRRELQAELVSAELVRIDTVVRYNHPRQYEEQQLTWVDERQLRYVSYADINRGFKVGTRITMLKLR